MTKLLSSESQCLCGNVKIRASSISPKVIVCHCGMCRKWGGPALALDCGSDLEMEGSDNITVYDSSEWAERAFCSNCGTHLFYRIKETGGYSIPAGFFPDLEELEMDVQCFIDKKPSYYSFSNRTKELTEKEVFDLYAPKE